MTPGSRRPTSDHAFTSAWLALREPVDHQARALALLPLLKAEWRARRWSRVLDLASGTGSNLRYLAPRLPEGQEWTVVDQDAGLLAAAQVVPKVRRLTRVTGDVANEGLAAVAQADVVTASALVDLVSDRWLRRLAGVCQEAACGVLLAMTYDGSIAWQLESAAVDPVDDLVRELVNRHQTRDKGLGPALGPSAPAAIQTAFRDVGYRTWFLASPWRLGTEQTDLVLALVDGWQRAAIEQDPSQAHVVREWAQRRRQVVDRETFLLTVGHVDMLALPAETA